MWSSFSLHVKSSPKVFFYMVWVNPGNYRTSPTITVYHTTEYKIIIIYEAVTTFTYVRRYVHTIHTLASIVSAALVLRKLRASAPLISKRRITDLL